MDYSDENDTIEEICPRCGRQATMRFYGPCDACCAELRTSQVGVDQDQGAVEYEPKMNVTPNAVASKE